MADAPSFLDAISADADFMGTVTWHPSPGVVGVFTVFSEIVSGRVISVTLEAELRHAAAHAVRAFISFTDALGHSCDAVSKYPHGLPAALHLTTMYGNVAWTPLTHLQQHIAACNALQVAELKMTVAAEFRRRLRAVVVSTLAALAVISPQLALRALDIEDVSQLDSAFAALSL